MPETYDNDMYGTDKFVYGMIKEANESLCQLDPNSVTLSNMILSLYIGYCFLHYRNVAWLYFLVILRAILDILDGGIARKCDKQSELGKYLDNIGDLFFFLIICYVVMVRIKKRYGVIKRFIPFLVAIAIYVTYKNCTTDYDLNDKYRALRLIHDNTILISIVLMYGLLRILN